MVDEVKAFFLGSIVGFWVCALIMIVVFGLMELLGL